MRAGRDSRGIRCGRSSTRMTEQELLDEVRRLRATNASPKAIARALGLRPAVIAPLVRRVAAESAAAQTGPPTVRGCWISPGWSCDLGVEPRDGWEDVELGPGGPAGLALVLVARTARHDRVTVCGYLVDTFCLGVKDVIGPQEMRSRDLPSFRRMYFIAFLAPALPAPIDLAQHLVLGAVNFAGHLGLDPHADFAAARAHLGELAEPCAITFGRRGSPLYVAGLHDDPSAVVRTLRRTVGDDGFAVAA